ncbi:hypothetical protein GF367_03260 [Candidatus Woesearchaeota archaeon]|nr:hypothetical protein [Candidatus Woesearchaeota archaeon]
MPGVKLGWRDLDITMQTRMNGEVFDFEDALEGLLAREAEEGSGAVIDRHNLHYINSVAFVRPDGIPVVLLKFAAKYVSGDSSLEDGVFVGARGRNTAV